MAKSSEGSTSLRRTLRKKKPSLKAVESVYASKLRTSGLVVSVDSSDEDFEFSDWECDSPDRPQVLHRGDTVKGEKMFAFQKRKQSVSLALKIAEVQKTPRTVRSRMKRKIKAVFEDSGSEYEVSSESSESNSSGTSDSSDEQKPSKARQKTTFSETKGKVSSRGRKLKPNSKYTIDTEEYFANSASNKIKTSNNTLDKLQTPRLPQYELQKLLTKRRISSEHMKVLQRLTNENNSQFKEWLYVLNQNFSILLYGLGSKKNILSAFQKQYLKDTPCRYIVVNGYFPALTIKNIIDGIIEDLLELEENPSNLNEAVDLIIQEVESSGISFYLLINNIEAIRSAKAQNILASLASIENIHLIATIDHINAPLIWDHSKLSKFNFTSWDVTSFSSYQHETESEMSSMTQQNSSLALSSVRNVFLSLTQNSKGIYLKLAKHQIENSGQYYQGMAFKDLYMACRESFIVSSDLALRAQLSEFLDHKMIKTKRSIQDGTEYLIIPLSNRLLQEFMEEN